jgi:penicillin-insensitive murein endopeptidase
MVAGPAFLAHPPLRRYSAGVPRPLHLLLAALALVALAPVAARADEPAPRPTSGARFRHHRRHHHRRAKVDEPSARASRDGSSGQETHAVERTAVAFHPPAKHAPAERAESVGSPNDGHLKGGVHVDLSRPYFRVVPVYESGDVRWGHPQLINMIDRAARAVHKRFPGSVLDVGDLSQRGGGDLLRHHSHESGRDADLGFYVVDAKGKQVHARTFIKFDTAMASPTVPGARYDMPRNWAFVQELLTDPVAHVSHIFIAEWIRHEVLAYARHRVSGALWDRAATVMMQPHNSLPHDDHFHVRISCPHDSHGSCIELAKVAPHGKGRVAHKSQPGGHVLRTPAHVHPQQHPAKPPAASATAPLSPLSLPAVDPTEVDPDGAPRDLGDDAPARIND